MQTTFLFCSAQLVTLTAAALLGTLPTIALQAVLGPSAQVPSKIGQASQATDDRGSGRIFPHQAKSGSSQSLDLLAFRGSGRVGSDDEQLKKSNTKATSSGEGASTFLYRGSGRIFQLQANLA